MRRQTPNPPDLCSPRCRYRLLYEGSQESLENIKAQHEETVNDYQRLRAGVVSVMKRAFPALVRSAEHRSGRRISSVDDDALVSYLEGFVKEGNQTMRLRRSDLAPLRSALTEAGYDLPPSDDPLAWAQAVLLQGRNMAAAEAWDETEGFRRHRPRDGFEAGDTPPVARQSAAPDDDPIEVAQLPATDDLSELLGSIDLGDTLGGAAAEPSVASELEGRAEDAPADAEPSGAEAALPDVSDLADLVGGPADDATEESGAFDDLGDLLGPQVDIDDLLAEEPASDLADLFEDNDDPYATEDTDMAGDLDELLGVLPIDVPESRETTAEPTPEPVASQPSLDEPKTPSGYVTPDEVQAAHTRPGSTSLLRAPKPQSPQSKPQKKQGRPKPDPIERDPSVRASRPARLDFDVPDLADLPSGEVDDELASQMAEAVWLPKPVFISDLAEAGVGDDLAAAWEAKMRSVDKPTVRFVSAPRRHRKHGSLVLPVKPDDGPAEWRSSLWAEMVSAYKGTVLYEMGILISSLGDQVVSASAEGDIVVVRAKLSQGLVKIVVVTGADLAAAGPKVEAAVTEQTTERLASVMVLVQRPDLEDKMVAALAESFEGRPPLTMPVAVTTLWKFSADSAAPAKLVGGL